MAPKGSFYGSSGARELFFWILRPQISLGANFYPNCSRSSWEMKRLFLIFFWDFLWTGHRGEVEWFLNDPKIIEWSIPRLCGASFGVIRALPPPNPFFVRNLWGWSWLKLFLLFHFLGIRFFWLSFLGKKFLLDLKLVFSLFFLLFRFLPYTFSLFPFLLYLKLGFW